MTGELTEATSPRALPAASAWVEQALSGQAAIVLASIAVAALGLALFTGRVSVRRALATLLGCFLLFGAPTIGRSLHALETAEAADVGNAPPAVQELPTAPPVNDPYAGASVIPSG